MAKKDLQFSVDVNGNISGLNKAMNEATALMRRTANTIKNIDMAVKDDPNNLNLLKERRDKQIQYIEDTKKALKELQAQQKALVLDKNFKKGVTDGLEFSKLTKEISKTKKELKDAKKDLNDMNLAVSNFTFDVKMRKVTEELQKAKSNLEKVKASLDNINNQIKFDPYNVQLYADKQAILRKELEAVDNELIQLNKQKKLLDNSLFRKQTEEENQLVEENALKIAQLTERKKELQHVVGNQLTASMEAFANRMKSVSESMYDIANRTSGISNAFKAFLLDGFDKAKQYETNIASIKKVVGDLSDSAIEDLKDLAVETGNAFSKVSEYATISGALGLSEDEIVSFTKAMLDLNAVSGGAFSGEEGAKGIAVFLNQLNLGIEEAENFGSAIAVIGDKYADIGDETVNVATKISGLSAIIDTNQYELLGLAGVMADLGLSSDTSANAINRAFLQIESALADTSEEGVKKWKALAKTSGMTVAQFKSEWGEDAVNTFLKFTDGLKSTAFNEINDAVANSTKLVDEYAKALGITSEEFKTLWGKDSKRVFEDYIEQLGNLGEENESASLTLKTLGISSVNTAQTLLRLAGSGNDVREAIRLTTEAWNENTALQEKTAILYGTTQSKLESLYESFNQLKASLVESVLPSVKDTIDTFTTISQTISKLNPNVRKLLLSFVAIGSSISPTARAIGNMASSMFKVDKATGEFIRSGKHLQMTLGGTISLISAGVLAVGALTTAIIGYVESTDKAKFQKQLNESFIQGTKSINDMRQAISDSLLDWEVSNHRIKDNITSLEEMYKVMKDGTLTEEESKEAKQKLIDKCKEINEALGSTFVWWDESTGKLMTEKGAIEDELIPAYNELEIARKKAFAIEEMSGNYDEAIKMQADTIRGLGDVRKQYRDTMKEYTEEFGSDVVSFGQMYAVELLKAGGNYLALSDETKRIFESMTYEQQLAVSTISGQYTIFTDNIRKQRDLLKESTDFIQKYDMLVASSGKETEAMLFMYEHGVDNSNLLNGIQLQNDLIKEANEELQDRQFLSEQEIVAWEKQIEDAMIFGETLREIFRERGITEEQLHDDIMRMQAEQKDGLVNDYLYLYDPESGKLIALTQEGMNIMKGQYSDLGETAKTHITKGIKDGVDEGVAYGNAQSITIQGRVLWQNLSVGGDYSAHSGRVTRTENIPMEQSGGFGIDKVISSLSHSFSNMRSSGYNSRGIYLNANFTINNASNLTNSAMAREFARDIIAEINNGLGMEI